MTKISIQFTKITQNNSRFASIGWQLFQIYSSWRGMMMTQCRYGG